MNKIQKILTGIALVVFLLSLLNAPWGMTTAPNPYVPVTHYNVTAPLWSEPAGDATLQVGELAAWWFGLAVIYAGLFLILKRKAVPKIDSPPQKPASPLVQSPTDSPPATHTKKGSVLTKRKIKMIAAAIVGLAVLLVIFSGFHTAQKQAVLMNCKIFDLRLQPDGQAAGFYDVVGRLQNDSAKTVAGLKLKVFVYASDKTLIDTEPVALTFNPSLAPGDVKPFSQILLIYSFSTNFSWSYAITDVGF